MTYLQKLSQNLKTQDTRMTSNGIFYVQSRRRIYGIENSDDFVWVDDDYNEVEDEELIDKLNENDGFCQDEEDTRYHKYGYIDIWENKQPFLTEAAAKRYIEINGHNLTDPRIYVESGWRNEEWQFLREYFKNITI